MSKPAQKVAHREMQIAFRCATPKNIRSREFAPEHFRGPALFAWPCSERHPVMTAPARRQTMLIGCIGDDFTGSSDLANTLCKQGMRTVLYTGIPRACADADVEAGIVALKSRSIPSKDAVKQSIRALEWLIEQGCEQFFFKYCSTFDSTREGNIGPVVDALADALDANQVLVCPAFPGAGRTVYQGHLFVNDRLLNESGMENHPLTPMTDPDIRRWLGYQTRNDVGHVASPDILAGARSIKTALEREDKAGRRLVVLDALRDEDLMQIGVAANGIKLVTGGSGVALGLPENFRQRGLMATASKPWTGQARKSVVLCGSCSTATRTQIAAHGRHNPTFEIDANSVIAGKLTPHNVADWLVHADGIPLAYSSADPEVVKQNQAKFGREVIAHAFEDLFAKTAQLLVDGGIESIIVGGGETSGAVVEGLSLDALEIGPEIAPGVPALRCNEKLVMALKSGNFGGPEFFKQAAATLSKAQS
jgi:uncharacterized protein YgbK (DUF1537 family)